MDCCGTNSYSVHHFSDKRCGRADNPAGDQVQDSFDTVSAFIAEINIFIEISAACSHTEPFTCEIRPRDERARKLVLDSCQD